MDASTLARIEFQKEIGQFTDPEREALIYQLILSARRIKDKQWESIDIAELSAPDELPRVVIPG